MVPMFELERVAPSSILCLELCHNIEHSRCHRVRHVHAKYFMILIFILRWIGGNKAQAYYIPHFHIQNRCRVSIDIAHALGKKINTAVIINRSASCLIV